jgi:hypothetical protein
VTTNAPTPELLNRVGYALLRSVATGQGDPLRSAADAIGRLNKLLPDASPEGRMVAVLLAISSEPTPQAETMVQSPTPSPSRRKDTASQSDKQSRQAKPATPRMDASGRLLSSKGIGGIAVISQAEARRALGVSCVQMLKLEDQKLLVRIQESGSRLVYYAIAEVQKLLNLIHRDADPVTKPDDGDAVADPMA